LENLFGAARTTTTILVAAPEMVADAPVVLIVWPCRSRQTAGLRAVGCRAMALKVGLL
jgi:hypothetical protein